MFNSFADRGKIGLPAYKRYLSAVFEAIYGNDDEV